MPDTPILSHDRLPNDPNATLFGRAEELKCLDACWHDPHVHLLEFHAMGGAGKTALVRHWLDALAANDYGGAQRIYTWSFYSQGAGDHRQSSAEPFIVDMLRWFGDDETQLPLSPTDRARRLAEHIRRQRSLLILDGVEPLQYPPGGPEAGKLKDPGLAALLRELAAQNNGLCILTTRMALTDLNRYDLKTLRRWPLEQLDDKAGADLLHTLGVRGKRPDLEKTARDYKGHALALRLLGNYLRELHGGDLNRRDRIRQLMADEQGGEHARHVMEAYVHWFEQDDRYRPDLTLLLLTGLFDRPAPVEALDALLAAPALDALTAPLKNAAPEQQKRALNHLADLSLLSSEKALGLAALPAHLPGLEGIARLDTHPLVREFFGEKMEKDNPQAFRQAHAALYEYYKALPEKLYGKHLPDDLEEMEPLFAAVMHGCRAGKQQEAMEEVYWERIRRKDEAYSVKKLGAFGSDLTALVWFFERFWDVPSRNLSEDFQSAVLSWAGFRLHALGRLREAVQPMKAAVDLHKSNENWQQAALNASNLSDLCLALGDVKKAVRYGRECVEYADLDGTGFQMEINRCTYADALHIAGEYNQATNLFEEAERMQQERQPIYQYLYSLSGYRYCNLLIGQGRNTAVEERAKQTLELSNKFLGKGLSLWDIGLDHLSLGTAYALLFKQHVNPTYCETAKQHLDAAIAELEKAGVLDYIARGLLARAAFYRITENYAAAEQDLAAVLDIAEPSGMRLHLVDYHIEMARLKASPGPSKRGEQASSLPAVNPTPDPSPKWEGSVEWHKAEALRLIKETGYKRRLKEAEEL